MYGFRNFIDKVKRYGQFSPKEIKGILLSVIIIAFILSFRQWGKEHFSIAIGINNFLQTLFFVGIGFLAHQIAHRAAALSIGYKVEYQAWVIGLVISLILAFVSNGVITFLAMGGIAVTHLAVHRLGRFRYGLGYHTMGWIALAGPLANVALAIIFKSIEGVVGGSALLDKGVSVNLWMALWSMIPVPPFDGSKTFFGSRYIYLFALGAVIGIAVMITLISSVLYAVLGSLVLGTILLWVFFVYIDKQFK
ncbi:hypothetical protein HY772_01560 [Candidatus Woesearchaeota archaeon]|nr:hypothetical protein [Candidatus Woesearchaeota archaeon]